MKRRALILALLIGPLPLFAQVLPPGTYRDYFFDGSRILLLQVSTNGPIEMAWGKVNRITGAVRAKVVGEATNMPNGRIVGTFPDRGRLRGRVRDGGTNGLVVTGTFHVLSRDGENVFIRRFRAHSR